MNPCEVVAVPVSYTHLDVYKRQVVLFNTGTAYKYLDVIEAQERKARPEPPVARNIGGIIGPY